MTKVTNENKEVIEKNLKYIGLDLDKVPSFLKKFESLNFRPLKTYDNNMYKVYKYVNIKDIQILLTPTDRLTHIKEKYKLASPIFTYLDSSSEENIEKFATFLNMLSNVDVKKIEEIQEEQEKIKNQIPCSVKYSNHYIWQIYYSDYAKKYFMIVPTKEKDNNALFYILKKQLSTKKREKIFVPITHLEYSGEYLTSTEISDLENYLWYFTKEWPSIYEIYDDKDRISIRIIGQTSVYEKIKSDYFITLNSKEEAIELYKLLKAMFILSTGVPEEYKMELKISEDGKLEFYHKDVKLIYGGLPEYINAEYNDKISRIKKEIAENIQLKKRLERFNNLVEELTEEYLAKQRQIATFLECKKTFFGRVKYYFRKKDNSIPIRKKENYRRKEEKEEKEQETIYEEKEQYTIEDLINICSKLQEKLKNNTNLNLDIIAIENKKEILTKKVDNAELYIKEIDKHKKSIFEFWKFTSKDEVQTLNEGEGQNEDKKEKIKKFFNFESDFEDLGKIVDELQKRKLSKNETDAVFAAKHEINSVRAMYNLKEISEKEQQILEKQLKKLKEEYKSNLEYINIKDFNIFGGLSEDNTKIKFINNQKHREIEKDKYKVLNINLDTDLDVYIHTIQNYCMLIKEALNKIKLPYNLAIYKENSKKSIEGINIYEINPENVILEMLKNKKEKNILCKINIKENMPILFYSNSILFDNFNKTLPTGMNLSTEVLVDIDKIDIKCIKETEFNINTQKNEFEVITKKVKVYEYEAENREEFV